MTSERPFLWRRIIGKKDASWLLSLRSDENNPLAPLWQTESLCVYDAVGPSEAPSFQLVHEKTHALAPIQVEHERDILEKDPTRPSLSSIEETKHVCHQTRVSSTDSRGSTGLTQILAGETSGNQIDIAEALERSNVPHQANARKLLLEHLDGAPIALTKQGSFVACLMKPVFDAADAGKESRHSQFHSRRHQLAHGVRRITRVLVCFKVAYSLDLSCH